MMWVALYKNAYCTNGLTSWRILLWLYRKAFAVPLNDFPHFVRLRYTVEILPYALRAKGFLLFNFTVSLSLIFNQWVLLMTYIPHFLFSYHPKICQPGCLGTVSTYPSRVSTLWMIRFGIALVGNIMWARLIIRLCGILIPWLDCVRLLASLWMCFRFLLHCGDKECQLQMPLPHQIDTDYSQPANSRRNSRVRVFLIFASYPTILTWIRLFDGDNMVAQISERAAEVAAHGDSDKKSNTTINEKSSQEVVVN